MVTLTWRRLENTDLVFFQEIISSSSKWRKHELRGLALKEYMEQYDDLSGEWRVWEESGKPVAVSFHIESAPSNQKPWLGTILVKTDERRRGVAASVVEILSSELKEGRQKALFAGVPLNEFEWANFLSDCGFEQFKTEENKGETFLIMVRPFE